VDAFDSHRFVAILVNGFEEEHRFRLSLLNDPRFVSKVDDIVVEFGGSRYQDVMDRFIAGDEVPYNELKRSWQQTTKPHHVSDAPIYEEFFRAVRAANDKLPEQEKIRVLLADPPIDWTLINGFEDLLPWLQQRMPFEAGLVEREVLSKNRRALLLFAAGHVLEESPLVAAIRRDGQSLFKIWTADREDLAELEPSVMSWPRPSIALVKGTILGMRDLRGFYMESAPPGHFEDQFDAILYLGPPSSLTYSEIAPELCSDGEYLSFRIPRLEMAARNGAPSWLAEFRARCANIGSPVPE